MISSGGTRGEWKNAADRWGKTCVAAALALSLPACFFYDSRWGEAKKSQQRNAQHAAPATLGGARPDDAGDASPRSRVLRVRVHATPRHAAEVPEWQQRIADALRDANGVLGPVLGVRLDLAGAQLWNTQATEDDLGGMLDELASMRDGGDADRIIGLVGSVPRFELSFHELGMGRVLGTHLVLRAMNDAREYEAIQRAFDELDEAARVKLYRARRRHKIASVLLHEIGHTFGVPHETERTSVMHRSYDAKASGFGPAAVGAMRMGLAREVDPSSSPNAAFAEAFIAHLTRTSSAWIPADRDEMIARLEKLRVAGAIASASASAAAAPPGPAASAAAVSSSKRFGASDPEPAAPAGRVPAIAAAHRAPFERAQQLLRDGQVDEAWSTAKPLFDAYPQDYAVQDLRCQIAMKRTSAWAQTQRECETLMRLARPAKAGGGRERK